ncbi:MAG: hypothetical protein ACREO9_06935, partial [Lysobacterales bacterium]
VQFWFCAGLAGVRGRTGDALALEIAKVSGARRVRAFAEVGLALETALAEAGPDDSILVFGSFMTASQAMAFLNEHPNLLIQSARDAAVAAQAQ